MGEGSHTTNHEEPSEVLDSGSVDAQVKGDSGCVSRQDTTEKELTGSVEGRMQSFRRWVKCYRDILDPVAVLIIALGAALATGYFAWKTNEINNAQREMLQHQIDLQAAQSLPIFSFFLENEFDETGGPLTQKLILKNNGGMARNASVQVYAWVQIGWDFRRPVPSGYGLLGGGVPLPGYFTSSSREGITTSSFDGVEGVFGFEGNWREYGTQVGIVIEKLKQNYGVEEVRFSQDVVTRIDYTDYMGNDRTEWYMLLLRDTDPIPHLAQIVYLSNAQGERLLERFRQDLENNYTFDNFRIPINMEEINALVRMLYEDNRGRQPAATPTND